MDLLTPATLQYGAGGLVALFVLAILTGRLVPRSTLKTLVDQANQTAEMWRRTAEREAERGDLVLKQSDQLLTGMDTIQDSMETLVRSLVPREKP